MGTVAPDMAPIYQLTATDQRHRATFNGIWDMGMGFQLSGVYFFGSGERRSTTWGSDLRNTGGANFGILTPAGTTAESLTAQLSQAVRDRVGTVKGQVYNGQFLLDRAQFVGQPIHRVDMRHPEAVLAWRAPQRRPDGGSVQHLQPRQLRVIHDDVQQCGAVRTAVTEHRDGVLPRILQLGFHLGVLT